MWDLNSHRLFGGTPPERGGEDDDADSHPGEGSPPLFSVNSCVCRFGTETGPIPQPRVLKLSSTLDTHSFDE